jgi:hypothetical protein
MGLAYRIQQFFQIMRARPDQDAWARASVILNPPLRELFLRMAPSDQAHGLRVFSALELEGKSDPDLLAAALLHDVGKSVHRPSVLDRVIVVLANQLFPRKVIQWGKSEPEGWRRPFAIARQHPRWGAELAAANGASPQLEELVRRHQEPLAGKPQTAFTRLLGDLRRADSEN